MQAVHAVISTFVPTRSTSLPFFLVHFACLLAFWVDFSWGAVAVCLGLFWVRMFAVTAGYHRYFSHRSFETSRAFRIVLAVLGCLALQKGVLWWASMHRRHHRYADRPGDPHSPVRDGFWASHMGWFLAADAGDPVVGSAYPFVMGLVYLPALALVLRHWRSRGAVSEGSHSTVAAPTAGP